MASARNIFPGLPQRPAVLAVAAAGAAGALFWNSEVYVGFLHCIGAVFAPLSAILFADYFLLRRDERTRDVSLRGLASLGCGIAGYWAFAYFGTPLGPTLSCLLLTLAAHLLLRKLEGFARGFIAYLSPARPVRDSRVGAEKCGFRLLALRGGRRPGGPGTPGGAG